MTIEREIQRRVFAINLVERRLGPDAVTRVRAAQDARRVGAPVSTEAAAEVAAFLRAVEQEDNRRAGQALVDALPGCAVTVLCWAAAFVVCVWVAVRLLGVIGALR